MTTRIYQNVILTENTSIELDIQASHHLARVLRVMVGDAVVLFNGHGGEYHGVIEQMTKKTVIVALKNYLAREAESTLSIWLVQGISRGEKMDYTIQKAVELGVMGVVPLFTERCNVKLDAERSEKRLQHWRSVMVSACEQSGRNRIPEIVPPQSLEQWLPRAEVSQGFVLSPYANKSLKKQEVNLSSPVFILIGPEGGLSEREVEQARLHHFSPLNLGPRILRTETAAIAAITALQCYYGDMA